MISYPRLKCGAQLIYDTSGGDNTYQDFSGALVKPPAIIIVDNRSNVDVTISDDGIDDFKTFGAAEAIILDLRMNRFGNLNDNSFPEGLIFKARSSAGSGNFYISYLYNR